MVAYIVMYLLIFVITFFCQVLIKDKWKQNKIVAIFAFVITFGIVAFRHPSMGTDLGYWANDGYLASFKALASLSWKEVLSLESFLNYEKGFVVFCKMIGGISDNTQFFMAACALIALGPVFYTIGKKSRAAFFSIIIYLGLPVFLATYSGLRQAIAIGICFFSLIYIQDKKKIKFAILVCFASLFHSSAFFFLLAYPIYYVKIKRSIRLWTIVVLPVAFVLRRRIFLLICKIIGANIIPDDNGAIALFLLLSVIYVVCVVFSPSHMNGLLNIFFVACFLQSLGGVYNLVLRVGWMFLFPLTILLPECIAKINDQRFRRLAKLFVLIGFIAFSFYNIYTSTWQRAYPYIPFWEKL